MSLTREQILTIRAHGLYRWCNEQKPPIEPHIVLSELCDRALRATQSDWVMVPVEPSIEMKLAARNRKLADRETDEFDLYAGIYKAMLAASRDSR